MIPKADFRIFGGSTLEQQAKMNKAFQDPEKLYLIGKWFNLMIYHEGEKVKGLTVQGLTNNPTIHFYETSIDLINKINKECLQSNFNEDIYNDIVNFISSQSEENITYTNFNNWKKKKIKC